MAVMDDNEKPYHINYIMRVSCGPTHSPELDINSARTITIN